MKAATKGVDVLAGVYDISIHAAREGGDITMFLRKGKYGISIHAAREGGDLTSLTLPALLLRISIHAAREGGDCTNRV